MSLRKSRYLRDTDRFPLNILPQLVPQPTNGYQIDGTTQEPFEKEKQVHVLRKTGRPPKVNQDIDVAGGNSLVPGYRTEKPKRDNAKASPNFFEI